ncbi:hypothetical protein [Arthrobacter sp. NEB 688]|uniref:hypothetical protein n=1 Tax=Arthrobacter sp. NEB 688 TaxID=904039 RepID=UPI001563DFA7|nr:hypothetical protein [Arthrobacter sp. NEB 688]QKE82495.1 hypothetical protein HL663_17020 [Arthrobacter sp. NEB 688]
MSTSHLAARLQGVVFHTLGRAERRAERGDVPGWVLITLMTAGLVTVLWAVAREQLVALFKSALSSVTG